MVCTRQCGRGDCSALFLDKTFHTAEDTKFYHSKGLTIYNANIYSIDSMLTSICHFRLDNNLLNDGDLDVALLYSQVPGLLGIQLGSNSFTQVSVLGNPLHQTMLTLTNS